MTTNDDNLTSQLSDLMPGRSKRSGARWVSGGLLVLVVLIAVTTYIAFKANPGAFHGGDQATAQAPLALAPAVVSITNSAGFTPATVYIKPGQAVTWTNTDSTTHFIVASNDPQSTGSASDPKPSPALGQSDSYSYVFSQAGTYDYHDKNSNLSGVVVVK